MYAYSRLKRVLKQQRLSVPELHRRMQSNGIRINVKSIYRLADDSHPVDRLDMRVAGAICQVCAVPLSEWIVFAEDTVKLRSLSAEKQGVLDNLMEKNSRGILTQQEFSELISLVREAEELTFANARLLAGQQRIIEVDHPEPVRAAR